jgi:D-alanyl-D-alanine carboxypeptidase/D-alanyl-D-alanine-endopeptidase (penicillin-binding protein 4)
MRDERGIERECGGGSGRYRGRRGRCLIRHCVAEFGPSVSRTPRRAMRFTLIRLFVGLAGALLVGVASSFSASAAPAATIHPLADLRSQLAAHLAEPRFEGALWGVKVASLETGYVLFESHAGRLMSPASNSKLYVGALALDQFGGDYRIVTPLLASAPVQSDGTLAGDIIVSGRGDPSWKARPRGGDFWATFAPFVEAIKQTGVRRVTGDVVADTTFFRMPAYGAGWVIEDLNDDYGAEISAITLEENFVDLRVRPAAVAGRACEFELMHPLAGFVLRNRTMTVAKGGARTLHARRELGGNVVDVFGELPVEGVDEMLDLTVPRPASWFAACLKEALMRAGIQVDGKARSVHWPDAPAVSGGAVKLGEITSPPMREMVAAFMKPSQNLETDLIFAHLGETQRAADAPLWRTSEQSAVLALREFLRRNLLHADDVRFDEGSGLSRNNLTSANATVALLRFMSAHRDAKAFFDSLPIAGVDGTVRRRMRETAAEGNVRAKTGSLRWANALSGYVTSAAGERLVFSVMLNRNNAPAGRFGRDDVDAIAIMLARLEARSDATETGSR